MTLNAPGHHGWRVLHTEGVGSKVQDISIGRRSSAGHDGASGGTREQGYEEENNVANAETKGHLHRD